MLRYVVAFLAVCCGIDAAPGLTHAAVEQSPELMVFQACLTFYAVVYMSGRLLYYLLGAHQQAQELYGWSSVHLTLLNTACGLTLVLSNLADAQEGKFHPAFFAGILAILAALWDGWRSWKYWRKQHGFIQ